VWIFPKCDGIANVGLGVQHGSAKLYLDKFISSHPEKFKSAEIAEIHAGPVPISGQIDEIVNNGAMLCGDAAGQVIPLTGGGIHSSIVAGKIAGDVAGKALTSENLNFDEYPRRYAYYTERIAKSLKALKVIESLPDSDLNQLAEVLSGEDIIDLANGLNIARVSKKLIKHPLFALKMAKALME
ncbi:MAG: NAD(P)/FAD-dependent oxidoreductase, partial [Candidatus Bathyarchaeia archaeon]